MPETYGTWLRQIRTDRGLTQEELGKRIGVARTYVNNIERGRVAMPNLEMRLKITAALGEDYEPMPPSVGNDPPVADVDVDRIARVIARWTPAQRRWLLDLMERTDAMLGDGTNGDDAATA
jgi:transcriptional regulator with XRE-family HTH domain